MGCEVKEIEGSPVEFINHGGRLLEEGIKNWALMTQKEIEKREGRDVNVMKGADYLCSACIVLNVVRDYVNKARECFDGTEFEIEPKDKKTDEAVYLMLMDRLSGDVTSMRLSKVTLPPI